MSKAKAETYPEWLEARIALYESYYEGFVLEATGPGSWIWHKPGTRNMSFEIKDFADGAVCWGDALSEPVAFRYKCAGFMWPKDGPHNQDYFCGKIAGVGTEYDADAVLPQLRWHKCGNDEDHDAWVDDLIAAVKTAVGQGSVDTYEMLIGIIESEMPAGTDMTDVYEMRLGFVPKDGVLRVYAAHRAICKHLKDKPVPVPEQPIDWKREAEARLAWASIVEEWITENEDRILATLPSLPGDASWTWDDIEMRAEACLAGGEVWINFRTSESGHTWSLLAYPLDADWQAKHFATLEQLLAALPGVIEPMMPESTDDDGGEA